MLIEYAEALYTGTKRNHVKLKRYDVMIWSAKHTN